MPPATRRDPVSILLRILQLVGVLTFAVAFFLPAINMKDASPQDKPLLGWMCAQYTLFYAWRLGDWLHFGKYPLILSGWLNPIVVLYLLASVAKNLARKRLVLVSAIAICLGASGIFLTRAVALTPLAGYYLWAAGAILTAAPEVTRLLKPRPN